MTDDLESVTDELQSVTDELESVTCSSTPSKKIKAVARQKETTPDGYRARRTSTEAERRASGGTADEPGDCTLRLAPVDFARAGRGWIQPCGTPLVDRKPGRISLWPLSATLFLPHPDFSSSFN